MDHVAPIQLAIRLLITAGSPLLELPEIREIAGPFNPRSLTHPWVHADPEVDRLQHEIERLVGRHVNAPRRELFHAVRRIVLRQAQDVEPVRPPTETIPLISRSAIPYLTEPWYC